MLPAWDRRATVRIAIALLFVLAACGDGGAPAAKEQKGGGEVFVTPPTEATTTPTSGSSTSVRTATSAVDGEQTLEVADITATATAEPGIDGRGGRVTYDARLAIDGDTTTTWRAPGDGRGVRLTLRLARPATIARIGLIPGYAKVDPADGTNRFTQGRRILKVRYSFALRGQPGRFPAEATFEERPEMQFETPGEPDADEVTIEILETTANPQRDFTAISEIELRGAPF